MVWTTAKQLYLFHKVKEVVEKGVFQVQRFINHQRMMFVQDGKKYPRIFKTDSQKYSIVMMD